MARRKFHWKHGWIPLTHAAALEKAHGDESQAAAIMARLGNATPSARRKGGTELQGHDTLPGLEPTNRELPFNRPVTPSAPPRQAPAPRPSSPAAPAPAGGDDYFRMGGKDLMGRAAKGDRQAQAELDRRVAKKAGKGKPAPTTKPAAPAPTAKPQLGPTPAEKVANAEKMYGTGSTQHRKAAAENGMPIPPPATPAPSAPTAAERKTAAVAKGEATMRERYGFDQRWSLTGNYMSTSATNLKRGDVIYTHTDGEVVQLPRAVGGTLPRYGKTERTVARVEKTVGGVVIHFTDGRSTTTPAQAEKGSGYGTVVTGRQKAYGAYTDQRAGVPGQTTKPELDVEARQAQLSAENREIEKTLPQGTTISSKLIAMPTGPASVRQVQLDTQYRIVQGPDGGKNERVGSVILRPDGKYEAKADGLPIGKFDDRGEAHRQLAAGFEARQAAEKRELAKRQAEHERANAANTEKARKAAAAVGGGWEPFTVKSDGTRLGTRAAEKVKQAFKLGDTEVIIETSMSATTTKALLSDISSILDKVKGQNLPSDLKFRVPAGDPRFRTRKGRGMTGGYVIMGVNTVHINPQVASGAAADKFGAGGAAAQQGHFMPASKSTAGQQYVITHELGHVLDGHNRDTSAKGSRTPSGFELPDVPREDVSTLTRQFSGELSKYGRTNNAEAYAEAFAQWTHGGPGSSAVADAFARRFGWAPPK